MADKKQTAAEKKAAALEAALAADAEKAHRTKERQRLIAAGAVLAAVALFVGGFAVGKSSSDDLLVGGSAIDRDGPVGGADSGSDFPGPRGPEGRFPEGREFPHRDGFKFPDGFEFPDGMGFGMECTPDGQCTFQIPEGFEFPGRPDSRPFPGEPNPGDEQPAANAGYLGVSVIDNPDGVVVGQVSPGSPADEAGLEPGDRFVAVDGIVIDAVDDLVDAIVGSGSGAEVEVVVDRDGSELSFDVILGSPPA